MLGPNNREACWEDSVGKIFSSCESKPLWKHSPASPAGRLTAPGPLLPLSHTQDEVAALNRGTSTHPHPWPTAPAELLPMETPPCTAHGHLYWGRYKDTSMKIRNLLYTTALFKFWACILFFWGILILSWHNWWDLEWLGCPDEEAFEGEELLQWGQAIQSIWKVFSHFKGISF